MMTTFFSLSFAMRVCMRVRVVAVWRDGVWNQMEEGVAQQAAGCEGQKRFQSRLHALRVIEWNKIENEKWSSADQERRAYRVEPQVESV
jgi:hypothetical protein